MMLPHWTLLLAEVRGKVPKPGDWQFGWGRVAIIAVSALLLVGIAWLVMRFVRSREAKILNSPSQLLKELYFVHQLSHRERQLVTRLAQHFHLEQPAVLFTEASWWDAERLGPDWKPRLGEIEKLRKRLFAMR